MFYAFDTEEEMKDYLSDLLDSLNKDRQIKGFLTVEVKNIFSLFKEMSKEKTDESIIYIYYFKSNVNQKNARNQWTYQYQSKYLLFHHEIMTCENYRPPENLPRYTMEELARTSLH